MVHQTVAQLEVHGPTYTEFAGTIVVFVIAWVGKFLFDYGKNSEFKRMVLNAIDELKQDVEKLEKKIDDNILPRREYDARHGDLQRRIDDIERTVRRGDWNGEDRRKTPRS